MNRQTLFTAAVRVLTLAFAVVSNVVIARSLGPAGQGLYAVGMTFAAVIVQFGNLGLHTSNLYYAASTPDRAAALSANNFWLSIAGGGTLALLMTLACIGSPGTWSTETACLALGAVIVPARMLLLLDCHVFAGLQQHTRYNIIQLSQSLLVLTALLVAGTLGASPVGMLTASIAGWWSAAVVQWSLSPFPKRSFRFNIKLFQDGWRYAAKSHVICVSQFLILRGQLFLLNLWHGEAEVGQYAVALQLYDVLTLLPACMGLVLAPRFVQATSGREALLRRSLLQAGIYLSLACTACGFLVQPFILIFFGEAFRPVVQIVWWMLPGVFCTGLHIVTSQYVNATGLKKWVVGLWVSALLLSLILSCALIPSHAGVGAAMTLSITMGATLVTVLSVIWSTAPGHSSTFWTLRGPHWLKIAQRLSSGIRQDKSQV